MIWKHWHWFAVMRMNILRTVRIGWLRSSPEAKGGIIKSRAFVRQAQIGKRAQETFTAFGAAQRAPFAARGYE
jgi:hypothetical protein